MLQLCPSRSLAKPTHLIVGLLICAALACADTVITPTGIDTTRGESMWLLEDGSAVDAYFVGVILISLTQNGQTYNRDTICVDLFTNINLNTQYDTQLLTPSQVSGIDLQRVAWLVNNALLPGQGNFTSQLPKSDWVTTAAQGAGLQLAIWDMVTDGDAATSGGGTGGLFTGRVQASTVAGKATPNSVVTWAETYERLSINKQSNVGYVYKNWQLNNPQVPAQMLEGPVFQDGGPAPAPEPGVHLVTGILLALLLQQRRH